MRRGLPGLVAGSGPVLSPGHKQVPSKSAVAQAVGGKFTNYAKLAPTTGPNIVQMSGPPITCVR